ncbi:hypothetical protein BOX15_Mlig004513g2 [Macrostomum lignano]|uniref:Coatomer subunit beta n=1 Tax=Macrostomum lignano TaxID=282301 RepID=A0A267DY15_9PLAT|nr:hypothetical protein BOX15_Mlig004513g3 [Macrostomum lignano]PAA53554.1 hypothetical protein BOX15_Mlig004513g2 [Macrostomum lignano]
MSQAEQPCYTLINMPTDSEPPSEQKLREDLEKPDVNGKIEALKKVIAMIINGEKFNSSLLMTVVKYVMPSQDHMIKKLLLVFWEVVPKYSPDGKLLHEMILVCDAYRKDLQHPNEFIRGSTLRFLCKLKEPELLEPLMPSIRQCLEYRHTYVRRNAILAIFTIYKNFDSLIPDAPELIASLLDQEQDASCKRNAFMMLLHVDQERALNYLSTCLDQVHTFGDILQLVIVELIYKVCHANPTERSRFIRCVYNLLQSSSAAVRYEAAGTLICLSSAPTAVRSAASAYIDLILKESDNNVKLIVLDRLVGLRETHERILQDLVMDVLRILSATDLEVRKKAMDLALELVTGRTIEEVVGVLKKEVLKTSAAIEQEETGRYRQLLVRTLHNACIRFPDVAPQIVPTLIEFLADGDNYNEKAPTGAAEDVLVFVREAIQKFDHLKSLILQKLMESLATVKNAKIYRSALWILGEHCTEVEDIQSVMTLVRQALGDLPLVEDELKRAASTGEDQDQQQESALSSQASGLAQKRVTADGTYASQTAFSVTGGKSGSSGGKSGGVGASLGTDKDDRPVLRRHLLKGDFFIGAALGTALTKLAVRYLARVPDPTRQNRFVAECMLVLSCILHLGRSGMPERPVSPDDFEHLWLCMKVLAERSQPMMEVFDLYCREALDQLLSSQLAEEKSCETVRTKRAVQPDDPVRFIQLAPANEFGDLEDRFDLTLSQALGTAAKPESDILLSSKLNKVTQLTGFSDPVYAEAYVHVNQYDIVLDVLLVNQTADTLQSLSLELATLGDLKLVEKPAPLTLASKDFANIKANIKVTSTENGIIFGNIVYDVRGAAGDRNCVVLNDIHIDIMDYIVPSHCSDVDFRRMWVEFEWENKVAVATGISDLRDFLAHLIKATNMRCLTPEKALTGECGFLAANLYARSIFGEDALANLSIEKPPNQPNAPVTGHIRIRAKSQGMAVTLGDKINMSQKQTLRAPAS